MYWCAPWLKWVLMGAGGLGGFLVTRKNKVPAVKVGASAGGGGLGLLIGWLLQKRCLPGNGNGQMLPQGVPEDYYPPQEELMPGAQEVPYFPVSTPEYDVPPPQEQIYPHPGYGMTPRPQQTTTGTPGWSPLTSTEPRPTTAAGQSPPPPPAGNGKNGHPGTTPQPSGPGTSRVTRASGGGSLAAPFQFSVSQSNGAGQSPPMGGVRTRNSNLFRGSYGS